MRRPDIEILIRRADFRDAGVIARHRARMFQDMGELSRETFDDFLAASQAWTERALANGDYIGWLAAAQTAPAVIVAGAGVQLRQVPPHPCRPSRDGVFAKGRHAIVLNVFTEPEWRNRGVAELLMEEIIRWAREEKLDRLVLHASAQARIRRDQRDAFRRHAVMKTGEMKSAKGAALISSLGQRPRISRNTKSGALKARFFRNIAVSLSTNERVELRFQRWRSFRLKSWGGAPGWHEAAPFALNTNICGMRDRLS